MMKAFPKIVFNSLNYTPANTCWLDDLVHVRKVATCTVLVSFYETRHTRLTSLHTGVQIIYSAQA